MDQTLRIGLLDADSDVRFGRRLVLESDPRLEIVFESDGKSEDIESIAQGLIDVLVLDQKLASGPAVAFYRELTELSGVKHAPSCVITSSFEHSELSFQALEVGVVELVALELGPSELIDAIFKANSGTSSFSLDKVLELFGSESPKTQLDLNFVRLVDELPEKLASNLRRLRQVWRKGDLQKLREFDPSSVSSLIERLPVKTLAQLIIKLHRSELLDVQ